MSGHISSRLARWRQIFRKKEKSWKTNEKTRLRVIEPQLEDQLLEAEFENLSSKLSTLCISQDFVSEMREAFYLFDKVFNISPSLMTSHSAVMFQDQNGYICSKELGALLRTLGCNPTEAEVNTLMASIDVDHNGRIDLLEFVVMMHQTVGRTDTMEEIRMAFRFAFIH